MKSITKISQILFINLLLATVLMGATSVKLANATAPYLQHVNYYHYPSFTNSPEGKLTVNVDTYKLMQDGDSSHDWYYYLNEYGSSGIGMQVIPGIACYGSSWKTYTVGAAFNIHGGFGSMVNSGPSNTDGYTTTSVSASISPSGGGFGFSSSYSIPYIRVDDYSDWDAGKAAWLHAFNPSGTSCSLSQIMRPYFVVSTGDDQVTMIDGQFATQFQHDTIYHSQQHFTSTLVFDTYMSGGD